ncbi:MAG: PEP-CTERM-box response regulator transcription factor [Gammaproteobacteria bacterium]
MQRLLVIDDDEGLCRQLKWSFDGIQVETAQDRTKGIDAVKGFDPQVVLLDLGLPPDPGNATEGLAALKEIREISPTTKVIVVTGSDSREHALSAISMGAYDYHQKPVDPDLLRIVVERALYLQELEAEYRRLADKRPTSPLKGIITGSPEMQRVCELAERVATANATVLIRGESGTGKELFARAIHDLSLYADGRFVAINCAAIPEPLLESELFGHEKGAFTGAVKRTPGKIELANNGTLFLDEVGDLPSALQAKLLRFLQERVIERVGGREEIPVDTRIICATHQDLQEMIAEGSFREDLYYRLTEVTIPVPPLRDRRGDIVLLAKSFLAMHASDMRHRLTGFTGEALRALEAYSWPGNVRELENRVKRAVIMSQGPEITPVDLELSVSNCKEEALDLRIVRQAAEERAVRKALDYTEGNISRAAELLGVTRPTLYELMRRLDIER